MYYIELKNTELLLKQHLAHFEYISFNCNNDNPFIVFLNTNRNNILIGSPTKHLEIINDLYQCILTETQTVPLSEYCDFNTMKIIQIMRNNETKNIIDIQFELVWPMPLKILRNKILKKLNKRTDKSDILDIFSSLASPLQELINYKNSPLDTIDDIVNYKRQTKTFWKQEFLTLHASQIDPSFHKNLVNMYLACEKEFNYSLFSSKENKRWSAYQLCKAVAPRICPYCNRNHTPVISNAERDFCRPELDHFIPKSIYPMFAVSFYNLIPSCHSCNHSKQALDVIKKDCFDKFSFKLCHPHVKKDDVTSHSIFTLENTQDVVEQLINYNSSPNITVGLEPNLETKILNSLEAFHLSFNFSNKQQGFYHHHDKEISDSLRLIYHYPKTALNKLNILLYQNSTSENIVSLQNLLIEQIMSTDCKNESLGKLKNDCLKEAVKYW